MRGGRADDEEDGLLFNQQLQGDLGLDDSSGNSTDNLLEDLRNLVRSDFTAGGSAENAANPSEEIDDEDVDKRHQALKAEQVILPALLKKHDQKSRTSNLCATTSLLPSG